MMYTIANTAVAAMPAPTPTATLVVKTLGPWCFSLVAGVWIAGDGTLDVDVIDVWLIAVDDDIAIVDE